MLPYLHELFDQQGFNELPKIVEVAGHYGSGKTTALVQLGWEYQQLQLANGCPKSQHVTYVKMGPSDGLTENRIGEAMMGIHIPSYSATMTIWYPNQSEKTVVALLNGLDAFSVFRDLDGIVLLDGVTDDSVLTAVINNLSDRVSCFAYTREDGVCTYSRDTIFCLHPGSCFLWSYDHDISEGFAVSTMAGLEKLTYERQLKMLTKKGFNEQSHYRREHNALFTIYRYGDSDGHGNNQWVLDQVTRQLTEQGYSNFIDNFERDGDPDGEPVYNWNPGTPP